MFLFVFTGEQRIARVKFVEDAAEGPHVDASVVGYPEHDFRSAVEARLDVGVYLLVLKASAAKIDYFYS